MTPFTQTHRVLALPPHTAARAIALDRLSRLIAGRTPRGGDAHAVLARLQGRA